MGHLIPAGTGFPGHRDVKVVSLADEYGGGDEGTSEPALA